MCARSLHRPPHSVVQRGREVRDAGSLPGPSDPAGPGRIERGRFEYRRHGTASVVAALDVPTGQPRNDSAAFTRFLRLLDQSIDPALTIHLVLVPCLEGDPSLADDLVLPKELAVRHGRRFRNGLRLSKLPHHKTLEDHCFSFQPELAPRKVKDLATLSFVEDKANAALLGPPGIGKTHIGVALAVAACQASYSIYFTSVDDMVRHLKAAEDQGRLISKLTNYLRPSVLMVDECPRSRGSFKIVMHRAVSLRLLLRRCEPAVQRGLRGDRVHPARSTGDGLLKVVSTKARVVAGNWIVRAASPGLRFAPGRRGSWGFFLHVVSGSLAARPVWPRPWTLPPASCWRADPRRRPRGPTRMVRRRRPAAGRDRHRKLRGQQLRATSLPSNPSGGPGSTGAPGIPVSCRSSQRWRWRQGTRLMTELHCGWPSRLCRRVRWRGVGRGRSCRGRQCSRTAETPAPATPPHFTEAVSRQLHLRFQALFSRKR